MLSMFNRIYINILLWLGMLIVKSLVFVVSKLITVPAQKILHCVYPGIDPGFVGIEIDGVYISDLTGEFAIS